MPLVELVTEPDFEDAGAVDRFLKEIQLVVRYLGISTADMEKGSMRLEANISLSADGTLPDYKVELKNINSFRFLKKAVASEIARQEKLLSAGKKVIQETRGWDEKSSTTISQRIKEEAQDYRYFPEPDIPPVRFTQAQISKIKAQIPELPVTKRARFVKEYKLPEDFIGILISDRSRADYFEESAQLNSNYKTIADLMINQNLDKQFPEPAGLVRKVIELSNVDFAGREVVMAAAETAIAANSKAVKDFKSGKTEVIGFLIGQAQKELRGKGEVGTLREVILNLLN